MHSQSVRVGLTALTLAFPLLIVAATEPGLSSWDLSGVASLVLVECALIAGMFLAARARRRLANPPPARFHRPDLAPVEVPASTAAPAPTRAAPAIAS